MTKTVMTKRQRAVEAVKTFVIIGLIISAVLLTRETELFTSQLSVSYEMPEVQSKVSIQDALPFVLAVTHSQGSRYAVKYGEVRTVYERFSSLLGEALGSAGNTAVISEAQWKNILSEDGVYFDFLYNQPLESVADWLGIESSQNGNLSGIKSRRICLVNETEGISLYFIDSRDGKPYWAKTMASSESMQRLDEYVSNDAKFVFEQGDMYGGIDPYAIIFDQPPKISLVSAANPIDNAYDKTRIFEAFGINSTIAMPYTGTDGSELFREGDHELRFYVGGEVKYSLSSVPKPDAAITAVDAVRLASSILDETLSKEAGAAELYLSATEYDEETNTHSISFTYVIGGIPAELAGRGVAAKILISGDTVTEAVLNFRRYSTAGEVTVLPESLMAHKALASGSSGAPLLSYYDLGDTVEAHWKRAEAA